MKHFLVLLPLIMAAAFPLAAADTPAAKQKTLQPPSVLLPLYSDPIPAPESFADANKAKSLIAEQESLISKIHAERKRILAENPDALEIREEILSLNRRLAALLEKEKTMVELNLQLERVRQSLSALPPAPPPEIKPTPAAAEPAPAKPSSEKASTAAAAVSTPEKTTGKTATVTKTAPVPEKTAEKSSATSTAPVKTPGRTDTKKATETTKQPKILRQPQPILPPASPSPGKKTDQETAKK